MQEAPLENLSLPQMKHHFDVHPTASVSPNARIADGVSIGAFCLVHDRVEIGSGTQVGAYCELGHPSSLSDGSPLRIGPESLIRSYSMFYEGSSFGAGLVTGHHVTVRELTRAGLAFQIGTKSDIQGHCEIGDHVRTHNNVHIGQKSRIGNFVWLFPDVLLTNDPNPPSEHLFGPEIGDFAVIAAKATLLPGVRIGAHAVIGAHSLVGSDVDPGMFASGAPAKMLCKAADLRMKSNPAVRAYPWPSRFVRGYPDSVIETWDASATE
jgi:acyl-[acyl carrier protein]--UDP-N-acetylglucosamine O-acyltransferase